MAEPTTTIQSTSCLGSTCLKWGANGDLTAQDLDLVLDRLAQVDQHLAEQRLGPSQAPPWAAIA